MSDEATTVVTPRCPWCGAAKHVQAGSQNRTAYCRKCKREFEPDDTDGVVGYGNPAKIVARQEVWKQRQQQQQRQQARR